MNKSVLKEKLKSYSALASAVFGTAAAADAQVVYTDVNPDWMVTAAAGVDTMYQVDFDNDGNADLAIGSYLYNYNYGGTNYQFNYVFTIVQSSAVAAMVGTMQTLGSNSYPTTTNVASGAAIGASSTWLDTTAAGGTTYFNALTVNGASTLGTANTGADVYLGARFALSDGTHYGWVRINVPADCSTLTVKDFAYDATIDTPINAGAMSNLGFAEIPDNSWTAYSNDNNIVVKADFDTEVSIIGLNGALLGSGKTENGVFTMSTANAAKGVYMVRITNGSLTSAKKIVLK